MGLLRYLSPGNMGVNVKSSANIAPIAHMSAKELACVIHYHEKKNKSNVISEWQHKWQTSSTT